MIKNRKEAKQYLKKCPEIKDEFYDLINSDPSFNYSKIEIIDWIIDYRISA